jgi:hypothetical protein
MTRTHLTELDEASIGHFMEDDNNLSGVSNKQAGTYSESAKNIAEQHHETELLQILSDANALYYLIGRPLLL